MYAILRFQFNVIMIYDMEVYVKNVKPSLAFYIERS